MKTRESEEMYLETILLLKKRKPGVRSVDIVEELGYAKSSVSRAVNLLQKKGYIKISAGEIGLSESGRKKAEEIYEKHRVLTRSLVLMGADAVLAEQNACRIEHVISAEMFEIIKKFVKNNEGEKL